jgi:hypothetical protein
MIELKKHTKRLWIGRKVAAALGLNWDALPDEDMMAFAHGHFPHEVFAIDIVGDEVFVADHLQLDGFPDRCVKYIISSDGSWLPPAA